jgi:ABC-type spermidine/putrescine transport system permease subunit II
MGGHGGFGLLPGGPIASIVIVALFVITLVVLAVAFYKLFQKAGFAGGLGLLMLIPVVNLGVALYLAFAEWPVIAELARVKLVAASVVPQAPAVAGVPTSEAPVQVSPLGG